MKKISLFVLVTFSLLLTACSNKPIFKSDKNNTMLDNSNTEVNSTDMTVEDSNTAINGTDTTVDVSNTTENNIDTSIDNSNNDTSEALNYENILIEVIGEDYFKDKALMIVEDQEICGNLCAVFKVGTNSEEKFTTEDWFAVSADGTVYSYDVVMDEWSEYINSNEESVKMVITDVDNCIYMLNEYLREEFAVEYYDMPEDIKQAIFEDENSVEGMPSKLIGVNEEIPNGYTPDPMGRTYYPVYNFGDMDELKRHFENYFTKSYMEEIELTLNNSLLEFDGTLYLVRGGMGYGSVMLDFDSFDYSNLEIDNTVLVDKLLFDEKNETLKITFDIDEGAVKISDVDGI